MKAVIEASIMWTVVAGVGLVGAALVWGQVDRFRERRLIEEKEAAHRDRVAALKGRGPTGPRFNRAAAMAPVTGRVRAITVAGTMRPPKHRPTSRREVAVGDILGQAQAGDAFEPTVPLALGADSGMVPRERLQRLEGHLRFKDSVLRKAQQERADLLAEVEQLKAELARERAVRPPAHPVVEALYHRPLTFAGLQAVLGWSVADLEPEMLRLVHLDEVVEQLIGPGDPRFQLRTPGASAVDRLLAELLPA